MEKSLIDVKYLKDITIRGARALSCGVSGERLISLCSTRREEFQTITNFIRSCHELRRTEFFLVSGTPGVGKTFLLRQVMTTLEREGIVHPVYINCFEIDNPKSIANEILHEIQHTYSRARADSRKRMTRVPSTKSAATRHASDTLERLCESGWDGIRSPSDSRLILLVLDEIDRLIVSQERTRTVFQLLDLLRYPLSNLCIFGISNQIGIPALYESKMLSRVSGQCIIRSYTEEELVRLIKQRLHVFDAEIVLQKETDADCGTLYPLFAPIALQVLMRKCGGTQGDARRVLHACEHVLLRLFGERDAVWKSLSKQACSVQIDPKLLQNPRTGLISPEYTMLVAHELVPSQYPELRNLPFLAHIVLAVFWNAQKVQGCAESVQHRTSTQNTNLGNYIAPEVPVALSSDIIMDVVWCMSRRLEVIEEMHSQNCEGDSISNLAQRMRNFAGIQIVLQSLVDLHILQQLRTPDGFESRASFRLLTPAAQVERVLHEAQSSAYPFLKHLAPE